MPARERLRVLAATALGLGYAPVAPGTFGSLGGLILVWIGWRLGGAWLVLFAALGVVAVGMWAAGVAEAHFGSRDPGAVVIDEVAGQMVSLLFLAPSPTTLIAGFLLFRLFDIWKPYPVRRLENLPGVSGIMADDLLAGAYANIVLHALRLVLPHGWGGT